MNKPFSLSAHERIKSKKTLDTLFREGKAFFVYPYRVVYSLQYGPKDKDKQTSPLRMAVSVPKRHFKRAHDRNRLKRLTRELYRVQKAQWLPWLHDAGIEMEIVFLYNTNKILSFDELKPCIEQVGKRVKALVDKENKAPNTEESEVSE